MSKRISSLPAPALPLTGAERFVISQPDPVATLTATTISVSAADNSFNDATANFVTLGFIVGQGIGANGCSQPANNIQQPSGVIVSVTANKIVVSGVVLVDETAGASITLTQWISKQLDTTTLLDEIGIGPLGSFNLVSPAEGETIQFVGGQWVNVVGGAHSLINSGFLTVVGGTVTVTGPYIVYTITGGAGTFHIPTAVIDAMDLGAYFILCNGHTATVPITTDGGKVLGTMSIPAGGIVLAYSGDIGGGAAGYRLFLLGNQAPTDSLIIAASDESTALTAGTAKVTIRMPYAFTLSGIRASLTTAQTGGNILTVDVNEGGVSILSTKITIDNGEKTSTTAATPAVISDTALADDAEITVDIDQIGDGTAKGLKVTLIGSRS